MTLTPGIGPSDSSLKTLDPRRWKGLKPPAPDTWTEGRKAAMRAISKSVRRAAPDPRLVATADYIVDALAGRIPEHRQLRLYPLTERNFERQALPPGATWTLTIWHRELLRVFVTSHKRLKRPEGIIADQTDVGRMFVAAGVGYRGRTAGGKLLRELVAWNFLTSDPRSRPAPDGVGRWRTANCYKLTAFAWRWYDLEDRPKSPRNKRVDHGAPIASADAVNVDRSNQVIDHAIPSNPDGTGTANPEAAKQPAKIHPTDGIHSVPRIIDGPATPAASGRSDAPVRSHQRVKTQSVGRSAPSASDEGVSRTVAAPRPPSSSERLQRPIALPAPRPPRKSDEEHAADSVEDLIRRHFGEPNADEIAAAAKLRGGRS